MTSAIYLDAHPFQMITFPGPVDRFHSQIEVDNETGCWLWQGRCSKNGYGRFYIDGREIAAHRFAFQLYCRPIGKTLKLDHTCSKLVIATKVVRRCCCNPEHLEPMSSKKNTLIGDGPTAINARKTFCIRNHPLTGPDARVRIRMREGGRERICLLCANARRGNQPR